MLNAFWCVLEAYLNAVSLLIALPAYALLFIRVVRTCMNIFSVTHVHTGLYAYEHSA